MIKMISMGNARKGSRAVDAGFIGLLDSKGLLFTLNPLSVEMADWMIGLSEGTNMGLATRYSCPTV